MQIERMKWLRGSTEQVRLYLNNHRAVVVSASDVIRGTVGTTLAALGFDLDPEFTPADAEQWARSLEDGLPEETEDEAALFYPTTRAEVMIWGRTDYELRGMVDGAADVGDPQGGDAGGDDAEGEGRREGGAGEDTCRDLLQRTLTLRADTIDAQARTVDAVLLTESPAVIFDLRSMQAVEEVVRMDGLELPATRQVPLLNQHDRSTLNAVLGSVRFMRTDGDALVGTLHFAGGAEGSSEERAWRLVLAGHLTDVSVGYRAIEATDIPAGETAIVKGQTYTAGKRGLRITTKSEVREASLVVIGADARAKVGATA